jgi:cell division protein FtsW (lipid II flippase)
MRDLLAVDKWMLLALAALLAIGMTMVLSTSYLYSQERYGDGTYFFRKQLIAMGAGMIALIACSIVPSTLYRRFAYPLLAVSFGVLALVLIPSIGVSRGGARRWLMLPGFVFQPSEFAKLALVFYLARSMAKKEQSIRTFSIGVLPHLIVGGAFALMLLLEPDDAALFHAFHRRRAGASSARHRANGFAPADLRDDKSGVPVAPLDEFFRSVERRLGQRFSCHPIFDRLRLGADVGTRIG